MSDALVTPAWLEARLADPNLRVIESSVERATYDEAHIPGAVWVDRHADVLRNGDESSGDVLTPDQYAALMRRLGVSPSMTVVWYGDRHSAHATRGFWMMSYYRHPGPLHVLDGGRERWIAEGRPMTAEPPDVRPSDHAAPTQTDASLRATWEDVRAAIAAADRAVLDVRSREEYTGESARAARGGHVPGAVNIEWTEGMADANVRKPPDELRQMYESAGITPDKEIITHCQLGVRASHTWFVLKHVLGYPNVRNYDGSWQEWGNRPDLPVER